METKITLTYEQKAFLALYKKFYGEEYKPRNYACKVKGQMMCYLLSLQGIECGNYGFLWDNMERNTT